MDLIPKPDQIVSAVANVASKLLFGGLADLRPMPRTLVDEGDHREVYHYRPRAAGSRSREHGDPVLLVTPLAAPALCFDLRRGCSLVEHLVGDGRPTYLVEYGEVSFANRSLGMDHWVSEVVPAAIREVSRHAGGRPVHVVGWSLGAVFALLAAADQPDLPIASLTTMGAPVDVTQVPMVAPIRPFLGLPGERTDLVTGAYRLLRGAPQPLVRRVHQVRGFNRLVTKPVAILSKLDDADFLAQVEAVDRFTSRMMAYPGRTFGQLYHRLLKGNQLASGAVTMDDRTIRLADLRAPLLAFCGASDTIAPLASVRPLVDLVPNVAALRFEMVPGGHLGMLTGRSARHTTWRVLDEWILEHSSADRAPAEKGPTKKGPAKRAPTKKAPAKQAPAKQTPSRPAPAPGGEPAIGANPVRRYGSASSRGLAARK